MHRCIKPLLAILFAYWAHATFAAEHNKLQQIEFFNMGGSYRLVLTCAERVVYVHRFDQFKNRLSLFLKNTKIELPKKEVRYERGFVRMIRTADWERTPPIAKVDIYFRERLDFEIKKGIPGIIMVDIRKMHLQTPVDELPHQPNGSDEKPEGVKTIGVDDLTLLREKPKAHTFARSKTVVKPRKVEPPLLSSSERISLDVRAAAIPNVLRLLAKQSKLNIVASNDVTGNVTVSLTDVTIKEALDMIVKANGLDYTFHGDVVLVKPRASFDPRELETKVYRLKYLDANNLTKSVAQLLSPSAKVQVFYQSFEKASEGSEGAEGTDEQKHRSSTLIVTDAAANIRQLDAMIETLDVPTPQIMIEAKLVEISPKHDTNLGINWDKNIISGIFKDVASQGNGQPYQYSAEIPLEGGGINYGTLSFERYNTVLNFLSKKTNSKLVSNPRILAMDDQEAVISVGTNVPIPQITRGVGGQGDVVTFEYRDVNIELKVTPHVGEDGSITLLVKPEVEEIIGEVRAGDNSAPITSKRRVETIVNLSDNETMVIGGLIRENVIETLEKVWLLGDIPLIGNFFRNKEETKHQTDLLIFITPRVVASAE